MNIRKLTSAESEQAAVFAREVILNEQDASWSDTAAEGISTFMSERLAQFEVYGLFDDDLKSILVYEADTMHIILLLTERNERRKGYATALLNYLKAEAEKQHCAKIQANVVSSAQEFYLHYGFEVLAETIEAGGMQYTPMEYLIGKHWLGKKVTVIVDHPYGSFHPHIADITYPVNTGYIDEFLKTYGEFQDAYVVGPKEAMDRFVGVVSAILYRKDDNRSYFIVTGMLQEIDRNEVIQAVGFEQQFYETRILWK